MKIIKKMKKLNEMLGEIIIKVNNQNHFFNSYMEMEKFIYDLENEIQYLEKLVKKCNFLNVDYGDAIAYTMKIWDINTFLANGDRIDFIFKKLLYEIK